MAEDVDWDDWRAKQRVLSLQKDQFKKLAKNPTDEMTVYRLQGDHPEGFDNGSLGIHWSTDPSVAHNTGIGAAESNRVVHRGTVSKENIILQKEWSKERNIRSYSQDDPMATHPHPSQWGLDMEAEVRLRPGSTVRDHGVAPVGDTKNPYVPSGREPTIEDRGYYRHIDIAHAAVQGTPEANRLHSQQGALPHKQMSMLDPIYDMESDRLLGHVPAHEFISGGGNDMDRIIKSEKDTAAVAHAAGKTDYDVWMGNKIEPMLGELRQPEATPEPQVHQRVANQQQFEGMEGFDHD